MRADRSHRLSWYDEIAAVLVLSADRAQRAWIIDDG
jgi:hypothetical protein